MATRTGFIGLGTIGKPMALNVLNAGFDLMVYDLRHDVLEEFERLGAQVAKSSAEIGSHAEIIEIAVRDGDQVEDVVLGQTGLLTTARPGAVIAVHSTIHPKTVTKVARESEKKGVMVIDANMSGGPQGAIRQELVFMVGGADEPFEKCRPVLETSGKRMIRTGPTGSAARTKVVQQALLVGTKMAIAEALFLAEKAGVDREALITITNESGGPCRGKDWSDRFIRLSKKGAAGFYAGIVPAIELAHEVDAPVPGLAVAQQSLALRWTETE